jgi:hypothetical protein
MDWHRNGNSNDFTFGVANENDANIGSVYNRDDDRLNSETTSAITIANQRNNNVVLHLKSAIELPRMTHK